MWNKKKNKNKLENVSISNEKKGTIISFVVLMTYIFFGFSICFNFTPKTVLCQKALFCGK